MEALAWIVGTGTVVLLFAWWAGRRCDQVDDFYEREQQDPAIFDAGSQLSGDRGT